MSVKKVLLVGLVASAIVLAGLGTDSQGIGSSSKARSPAPEPDPPGVTIPYPGRLANDAGQPVADGAYGFTFTLYDTEAGGELLRSEVREGVPMLPVPLPVSVEPQARTYLVNSDADTADANPGDGLCDIGGWFYYCTLHAAIQEANLDGGTSTINFASSMNINYPSLPSVTEGGTLIDASDQWDGTWPAGRPGVSIVGAGYSNGLLNVQHDYTTVRGIEFSGSSSVGVYIGGSSGNNIIGGSGTGQRNVFHGGTGVKIEGTGVGTLITGNYFGTWDGLQPVSSEIGIDIRTGGNYVEKNLIGGHTLYGIQIWYGDSNFVQSENIIGANKLKNAAMPNGIGVTIAQADYNLVWNNFIAGNSSHGVDLFHANYNTVIDNIIGHSFTIGNGGDGIHALTADNNKFGRGNSIHNNGGYGVWLLAGDGNLIQGNGIGGNAQDGVYIQIGKNNQIGGADLLRNEIGDNGGSGVHLTGSGTISNTLSGNYIGLSNGAFDAGNQKNGILIEGGASANQIGGLGTGEGNWIGWNDWSGIYITGATTQGNVVEGNVVGAPINWGWQAPNGHHGIGIYDGAHHNWIGIGNTVLSSDWSGIAIVSSDNNVVWLNRIGTNGAGVNWGNSYSGVAIGSGAGNSISANEIAYNGTNAGEAGVRVDGGLAGNPINVNSIHDNGGAGIELVNGGNLGLGAPTITQASCQGPVTGTSCAGCTIEIFSDAADEGRIYEGTTTAHATTGNFSWSGTPNGPNVTATATDGVRTSPFSAPWNTGTCNAAPTAVFTVNPTTGTQSTVFNFDASGSNDPEDPASALEVRWDWQDHGTYDTNWSTTKMATHTFTTFGLNTIRLQVRDTNGLTNDKIQQVTVVERSTPRQVFLPLVRR